MLSSTHFRSSRASADLAALRRRISELERCPSSFGQTETRAEAWRLGVEVLDRALPAAGLALDGLHDAAGVTGADNLAAAAFLLAVLRRLERFDGRTDVLVCWSDAAIGRLGRLHGPGWQDFGLDPARLLVARTPRDRDVLWAAEEGLRSGALAAVIAELGTADFTATRRLSLAAREGLTPMLLLHHQGSDGASAACTRWRIASLAGAGDPYDVHGPGAVRWRLDLLRCRGGRPTVCDVEWNRETGDFDLVAPLADRSVATVAKVLSCEERKRQVG